MLSGDNGVLQRATDAKQNSERAEAKEQAQIDIMAWITDKTANHQDASLDDSKVKEILTDKSYVKEAKESSFITAKGDYEILYSELYTATDKTPSDPATSAINYGSKTAQTVALGDEISIDTEKFAVLSNNGTKIKALPYYNLTLSLESPRQTEEDNYEDRIEFSSSKYWDTTNTDVDMYNSANNIQQYIEAYQTYLQEIAGDKVTTRVARYSDMSDSNLTPILRRYTANQHFWIGTSGESYYMSYIDYGAIRGELDDDGIDKSGVRPIIEITIP